MEALQPPHPLDKKMMASDTARISSLPPDDAAASFLLLLFVLFIFLLCMDLLKSHLFPFTVVGTRAIVIFLIRSHQTEVVSAPCSSFFSF